MTIPKGYISNHKFYEGRKAPCHGYGDTEETRDMIIPRGYVPSHKVKGLMYKRMNQEIKPQQTTIVICANCKTENTIVGKYDENTDDDITCIHYRMTSSKWNYD